MSVIKHKSTHLKVTSLIYGFAEIQALIYSTIKIFKIAYLYI